MGGVEHARKSMKELVANLNNMHVDTGLATTLALAFSESWDEHSKSGISHLRGARGFVSKAVNDQKTLARAGISDIRRMERSKFLCNTYIYMDVLARLTSLEETDHDVDHGYFEDIMLTVNGPIEAHTEVDPLLGCAYTLFPLIGRVANPCKRSARQIPTASPLSARQQSSNSWCSSGWALIQGSLKDQRTQPARLKILSRQRRRTAGPPCSSFTRLSPKFLPSHRWRWRKEFFCFWQEFHCRAGQRSFRSFRCWPRAVRLSITMTERW